jgi:hypothetical protein
VPFSPVLLCQNLPEPATPQILAWHILAGFGKEWSRQEKPLSSGGSAFVTPLQIKYLQWRFAFPNGLLG